MVIARTIRFALTLVTVALVAWSFGHVFSRWFGAGRSHAERPITLTILHWGNAAENVIVQKLVDRYIEENPKVRIVRIHASDFRGKLKTMMAAGTPPDLFYLPPDMLPELAELKLIEPIDDLLKSERDAGRAKYLDDFYPIIVQAWQYDSKTKAIGAGPLYGLPKDFTTAVFYINVNLFERARIDWQAIQRDGWTWDQFSDAMRKITDLGKLPEFSGRTIYGGHFGLWPDTIRNFVWTFGGDFFGKKPDGTPDFQNVTLDEPPAQEALELIRKLRLEERTVFNATGIAKDGGQEFMTGNIGAYGPVGRWETPRLKDVKFRWDVLPVPYKDKSLAASQIFLTAWTMSSQTRHRVEAFKLMEFLCGAEGAVMQSRLGLAIPALQSVANSPDFLSPPKMPAHNARVFLDAIRHARLQQIPREAEWGRIIGDRISASIQLGSRSTLENAREIEAAWLDELASPLRRKQWSPMRWDVVVGITAAAIVTLVVALVWRARKENLGPLDRATERAGWIFIAPWLLGFLALTLGPMIVSLLLSFTRWSGLNPIAQAESVGLANYVQLFNADPTFVKSLKVTGYYVLLAVPATQVAALAVALLMNLKVRGIAVFRTIYFVPSVVSGVALAVLWLQIFNNDYGLLNDAIRRSYPLLASLGVLIGFSAIMWAWVVWAETKTLGYQTRPLRDYRGPAITAFVGIVVTIVGVLLTRLDATPPTPPDWFGKDARTFAIPAFVIMSLWGVGGGMIIYLAGLKGIPKSLYEAARIDGASRWRQLLTITLPMLSPLIFYNLVMGIIGSFQVFTQAYVMTGAGPDNATLFYVLNLYRQAFEFHNMGYASAMAWVLFVIVLLLTLIVFRGSRSLVYYEGLRT